MDGVRDLKQNEFVGNNNPTTGLYFIYKPSLCSLADEVVNSLLLHTGTYFIYKPWRERGLM